MKYKTGDSVECNGNKQGRVLQYYSSGMIEVRLFSGFRHVGDVCVPVEDIKLNRAI